MVVAGTVKWWGWERIKIWTVVLTGCVAGWDMQEKDGRGCIVYFENEIWVGLRRYEDVVW